MERREFFNLAIATGAVALVESPLAAVQSEQGPSKSIVTREPLLVRAGALA